MKQLFSFFLILVSVFVFAQTESSDKCEMPRYDPLDAYQYIVTEYDTTGIIFYMSTPPQMKLTVECLSFDVNDEIMIETFQDVNELMFSNHRLVVLRLNTSSGDILQATSYIDWDIPTSKKPKSSLSTVYLLNEFPIRFKLEYRIPKQPGNKN